MIAYRRNQLAARPRRFGGDSRCAVSPDRLIVADPIGAPGPLRPISFLGWGRWPIKHGVSWQTENHTQFIKKEILMAQVKQNPERAHECNF